LTIELSTSNGPAGIGDGSERLRKPRNGSRTNGGGVAFFAHLGGFIFGALVAKVLTDTGRLEAQQSQQPLGALT
jgi:membrane associated rhomboid family serine protease